MKEALAAHSTAILHYTAPPVVGGVEAVIQAHAQVFVEAGYPVTIVAGRGEGATLPSSANFVLIPEMDSQHPQLLQVSSMLEQGGEVPPDFSDMVQQLTEALAPILSRFENVIVHNVLTMHFNLPLTASLHSLVDSGTIQHCIAWCHDVTWTSSDFRSKMQPGYPWDLLRTYRPGMTYVVVS